MGIWGLCCEAQVTNPYLPFESADYYRHPCLINLKLLIIDSRHVKGVNGNFEYRVKQVRAGKAGIQTFLKGGPWDAICQAHAGSKLKGIILKAVI